MVIMISSSLPAVIRGGDDFGGGALYGDHDQFQSTHCH